MKPSAIREILNATATPDVLSFAGGLPAPELFPVEGILRATEETLREDGAGAMQYGLAEGYLPLREWACAHLAETVGLRTSPDRVLITQGSQQGLDLVGKVLLDPGDTVLVENPCYLGALQAFESYEARPLGVSADENGILPEELRRVLESAGPRPKFLYLIPNFHNPTGTSLSAGRRKEVAALAAEFGVPVIEDDPYGSMRYSGAPLSAVSALPGAHDWLYLGTMSKVLCPGLRIAWLVAPDRALYERLVSAKQAADLQTSSFTQRAAWRYVRQPGALGAHLAGLQTAYGRRRDAMLQALGRHLPDGCRWTRPDGGLFIWVEVPSTIDTVRLLARAMEQKVAFVPGAPFWVGEARRNTLRLNFTNASEERIEAGIRRLGEAIHSSLSDEQ
jgi:2-aminoadipate transaminase